MKKKKSKKISPRRKKAKFICKLLILLTLLVTLIAILFLYFKYGRTILQMREEAVAIVEESTVDTFKQNQTSLVYDAQGNLISKLKSEKDVYYLDITEIPEEVRQAFISIEDKKFLQHPGIDFLANIRAVIALIKNKGEVTQGGSTITQQLSRNIFLSHQVTYNRKIQEMFIAIELEKKYSKSQILEFYINNIYFANGYYGIQAASRGYFSKDVDELSLSQIAFLAAIPNNPTIYDPIDHSENTLKRRNRILQEMLEDQKITEEEYTQAINEEITLSPSEIEKQNYVDTYVLFSATEAVMEAHGFEFKYKFDSDEEKEQYKEEYNEAYALSQRALYRKGYSIYTSIDMTIQEELQKAVDENLSKFTDVTEDGIYKMQGAAVCIDNDTGKVVAIVGGRNQEVAGYTLNRAYQSYRQPGSAIKPLIAFLPALQSGYTANTIVKDEKIEDGPKNSDGKYLGSITFRKAVETSRNTVAYNLYQELNPRVCLNYLFEMNFNRLAEEDYLPTAAIGGFKNGVSPLEMAAAYATIENEGRYRKPSCIVKIVDDSGEVFVDNEVEKEKLIYDYRSANDMTDILEGVLKSGTAKGYALKGMPSAGKTGTTNNNRDGWFVGYTPYYTTSVWVGYDIPQQVESLKGSTYPLYIWNDFMTEVHKDLETREFNKNKDNTSEKEEVVETPEPTEIPEETLSPEDILPEETEEPMETVEPTVAPTVKPEVTPIPEVTKTPEPTLPPVEETQTPKPTPKPTEEPEPTKAPEEDDDMFHPEDIPVD